MKCSLTWFLLVLSACLPACAWATAPWLLPQDLTVHVWGKQEGLPDNSVTSVLQTRDGYLWVGTLGGLARFDGVRFVLIAPTSGNSNELIRVTALCEDSTGRLWIGTQGEGLLWYAEGSVHRFQEREGLLDRTINSIAEDAAGSLWVGTPTGLNRLEKAKLSRFNTSDGLPNDFVSSVHVARSGTVWITTRGGMCHYKNGQVFPFEFQTESPGRSPESLGVYEDRQGNLWAFGDTYLVNLAERKRFNYFRSGDTSSVRIWSLCEGRNGQLWIGTSGQGLYCFADDKFLPLIFRAGRLSSDVRALYEDREGNLWLGTYGSGLVRLQTSHVRVLDTGLGLPNSPAVCLAFNAQGRSWIGFEHGGFYSGAGDHFERGAGGGGLNLQNLISSVCIGPDSRLWLGTPGTGLYCMLDGRAIRYTTADGLSDNTILSVAAEPDGTVWVGTLSGGLHRFAAGELTGFGVSAGLPGQPITAILPARDGGLWLGTDGGGVLRGDRGRFRCVGEPAALGGKAIRALNEDAAGRLWLGTASGRLACLAGGRLQSWEAGSAEESIVGILSDEAGDLWLGMDKTIHRIARRDVSGLLSGQSPLRSQLIFEAGASANNAPAYGWPRAAKSPDGKLWFGMVNGVVAVDPRGGAVEPSPPPVLIEAILANGQSLARLPAAGATARPGDGTAPIRLSSDLRSLELQFTALSFAAPEKVRFRYRLDGFDPDWVNGGADRKVRYGRLPYGTYAFHVQAGTAGDSWYEDGADFHFLIPPPVWRSQWALGAYGVAAIGLVAGTARLVSHRRLRGHLATLAAQQAMERERMRIAQNMHDEIGSKLTKISFLSERAKGELQGQEPVAIKLDSIASTSRDLLQSLDEIVWAVNPHNDTLEHLAAYLGHYATEYLQNTAVECELHIPRGLPHEPLSAETRHNLFLAFEEALNNALKHGGASRVQVEMVIEPACFEIRIHDNGCGFDLGVKNSARDDDGAKSKKRGGNGLPNMRQRLADVGGRCTIRSQAGQGTTVILTVPLKAETNQARFGIA